MTQIARFRADEDGVLRAQAEGETEEEAFQKAQIAASSHLRRRRRRLTNFDQVMASRLPYTRETFVRAPGDVKCWGPLIVGN